MTTPARAHRDHLKAKEMERQIREDKYVEFKLSCDEGDANGCNSLGEWYSVMNNDHKKAAEIYEKNCLEKKHAQSCFNLGMLLCKSVVVG